MVISTRQGLSRRNLLTAVASAAAVSALPARALAPLRLAAIDWAMLETAILLGHAPIAAAELIGFRKVAPSQPDAATVDLGLRGAPNLEALSLVAPDLVLSSGFHAFVEPQLRRIAPVFTRDLYVTGEAPLPKLSALLADLAAELGDAAAAIRAEAQMSGAFDALIPRAAPFAERSCLLFELGDPRHIRIFGADSLFGSALERIGMRNGWAEGTRYAFAAPLPLERLAEFPEARLVLTGDVPAQARRALTDGILWNSLAPVREGRVHQMPDMNAFGGLPSALRFASGLVTALEAGA